MPSGSGRLTRPQGQIALHDTSPNAERPPRENVLRYVTYGTSLSAEKCVLFWRCCGGAWVSLLRDHFCMQETVSVNVINESRWGSDSHWGVKNIASRVLRHRPNAVILEFAINDADIRKRISVDEAKSHLLLMADAILQSDAGCKIWLMTSHVPSGRHADTRPDLQQYYDMYRNLAVQKGFGLIDLYARWGKSSPDLRYMPDGIHPNLEAAKAIILPTVLAAFDLK